MNIPKIDIQKRLPLIIALVLGLIAVIVANAYLKNRAQQIANSLMRSQRKQQVEQVLVAKEDIPKGAYIEQEMVALKEVAVDSIQPRATGSIKRVVGKVAMAPIVKGEQILLSKLASSVQELSSLSYRTPQGKRAITIPVDNISSVGGMIRPNDQVDILGVIPQTAKVDGQEITQNITVPLFQKVLVLAVGSNLGAGARRTKGGKTSVNTITVALPLQDATMLAFVQEQGKLRFILRAPTDAEIPAAHPVNWDTLLMYIFPDMQQRLEALAQQQQQQQIPEVEIYRGTNREVWPLGK